MKTADGTGAKAARRAYAAQLHADTCCKHRSSIRLRSSPSSVSSLLSRTASCASRKRSLNPLNTMPHPDQDQPTKAEPTRLSTSDLLAVLRDAQSADLTAMKAASIINRSGHKITGFVVCHPQTHERCIVEMSACRWLTNEEMWWLMHVSESPLTANDEMRDAKGETKL